MKEEIIMAGFGGQGVMSLGRLLTYAGMKEGDEVSWMPSYGPEMRGGTANCTVIISSKQIPSPLSSQPDAIIVMNLPSLDKFAPCVKRGGAILLNSSLINKEVDRDDVKIIKVPANQIANELGNTKVANMVMLGAYLAHKRIVKLETVKAALQDVFPARRHNLIPINQQALDRGVALLN
ncbi:MAG: 2-oxoacid:acceptor oxidoreductase family protein [Halanaerobiales bacterium]|nr:2-oxoacid:acceptor oxidoreductase family protein [Halanaerobiales bacterium]